MSFLHVDRKARPPATRQQARHRRWIVTIVLLLVLVTVIVSRSGSTLSAPGRAAPGSRITVRASDLRSDGVYTLTLYAQDPTRGTTFCQEQIAPPQQATTVTFIARLPPRLPCYGSSGARATGSIPVTAGEYALIVGQRQGTGFAQRYSLLTGRLRIT